MLSTFVACFFVFIQFSISNFQLRVFSLYSLTLTLPGLLLKLYLVGKAASPVTPEMFWHLVYSNTLTILVK